MERRGRGRPKRRSRTELVELAMDRYWRDGVYVHSLNELCRRLSISKPSLYREFGGEEGLIEAVLDHYRELVVLPVLRFLELEWPFAETMEALIIGMTTPDGVPPGCLFTEMRMLRKRLSPQCVAKLAAIEHERIEAFERWYLRALERGEAKASLSAAVASHYRDAQFTLILLQMGAGLSPDQIRTQGRLALGVLTSSTLT